MRGDYPTEEELTILANFHGTPLELAEYVQEIWHWGEDYAKLTKRKGKYKLYLATGGWSGNEDIISALHKTMFWHALWMKSERGGGYTFEWEDRDNWEGDWGNILKEEK